jgi:hypothetical protein
MGTSGITNGMDSLKCRCSSFEIGERCHGAAKKTWSNGCSSAAVDTLLSIRNDGAFASSPTGTIFVT